MIIKATAFQIHQVEHDDDVDRGVRHDHDDDDDHR